MHRQSAALMTCIVPSIADDHHVHFVDGARGGYASAARRLKQGASPPGIDAAWTLRLPRAPRRQTMRTSSLSARYPPHFDCSEKSASKKIAGSRESRFLVALLLGMRLGVG